MLLSEFLKCTTDQITELTLHLDGLEKEQDFNDLEAHLLLHPSIHTLTFRVQYNIFDFPNIYLLQLARIGKVIPCCQYLKKLNLDELNFSLIDDPRDLRNLLRYLHLCKNLRYINLMDTNIHLCSNKIIIELAKCINLIQSDLSIFFDANLSPEQDCLFRKHYKKVTHKIESRGPTEPIENLLPLLKDSLFNFPLTVIDLVISYYQEMFNLTVYDRCLLNVIEQDFTNMTLAPEILPGYKFNVVRDQKQNKNLTFQKPLLTRRHTS